MGKVYEVVDDSLDSRVTPLAYIYAIKTVLTGAYFSLLSEFSEGVQNSILYKEGALVGVDLWGTFMLVGGLGALIGMLTKVSIAVKASALLLFMTWAFAAIEYGLGGYWHWLFPLAVIELLSCGYLHLAASLGRLWDYTPTRS